MTIYAHMMFFPSNIFNNYIVFYSKIWLFTSANNIFIFFYIFLLDIISILINYKFICFLPLNIFSSIIVILCLLLFHQF